MSAFFKKQSLEIIFVIVLLLGIGMSATITQFFTMPDDRIFAGFHGYSADYIQYVSYIKEGMYGRFHMIFRSFPPNQPITPIHWSYIFFGIFFGPLGILAPTTYHLSRLIIGGLLIYATYKIFYELFKAHHLALLSTLIAFISSSMGWITRSNGLWQIHILNYFPFYTSTPQRVADRPHYLLGGLLVLILMLLALRKKSDIFTLLFMGVISYMTVMIHIASGIVLAILSLVICGTIFIKHPYQMKSLWIGISIGIGCSLGALATYYYVQQYSLVANIFIDQYAYGSLRNFENIVGEILSFGPILWIGLPGLFIGLFTNHEITLYKRTLLFFWGIIHLALFFALYPLFHVDQVRFMQSLYYIPLTYGTIWLLWHIFKRFKIMFFYISITILLIISLPTYISHVSTDMYTMTDYKTYSTFTFPTKNQYKAFQFLDQNTPRESTVLAQYEAANLLLMYSHNRILGNEQGWPILEGQRMRDAVSELLRGKANNAKAYSYLTTNNVSYIYYGYQERAIGNISLYPFLKKIYENSEVTIYQVLSQTNN